MKNLSSISFQDHIMELLSKWENIDDEIWAKVIVLERNRRVAKAYVRAPVLTVNGGDAGFDGFRWVLSLFKKKCCLNFYFLVFYHPGSEWMGSKIPKEIQKPKNSKLRLAKDVKLRWTKQETFWLVRFKQQIFFKYASSHIEQFFQVKRFSKSPVYVKNTIEENAVSNDILKLPNGLLELEKPFKLFDMKKFQQNVNREMKRTYPDRRKLESQCISAIAFVRNEQELLDSPIWIMLINIVALEMLRVKLPAGKVNLYKYWKTKSINDRFEHECNVMKC